MANRAKKTVVVQSVEEWNELQSDVAFVFVKSDSCNEANMTVLDVSGLTSLQEMSVGSGCFRNVEEVLIEGLPSLIKVVIGENSFTEKNGAFTLRNCSSVQELRIGNYSFAYYSILVIEEVPLLTEVVIPSNSFMNVIELSLIEMNELRRVEIGENSLTNKEGSFVLKNCSRMVALHTGNGSMSSFRSVEIGGVPALEEIEIDSNSFMNVNELRLEGLSGLERVVIGENSFTKKKNGYGEDSDRHFYLKDCSSLKSLKMGRYSFSDYSSCEIENVDALEVIEIGELNEASNNFYSASLELKSMIGALCLWLDFPKLKTLLFGNEVMKNCDRVAFESEALSL